jgi:cytoskeleton protein RodZ
MLSLEAVPGRRSARYGGSNPLVRCEFTVFSLTLPSTKPMMTTLFFSTQSRAVVCVHVEDVCVGSFGERLQRERELRGINLEEIAEATKIGTRSLRALEEQDFDKLPGGIFNKGFVRAYARYLGLDEEQAVADYLAALGEAIAAGKATRHESTVNTTTPERNLLMNQVDEREPLRLPLGLIAVVVVIAALLFGGWKYFAKHGLPKLLPVRAASQLPSHPKTNNPAQAAAQPAPPPNPSQPAAVTPVAVAENFVVRVKAKEDSWVSIIADGKPVMAEMLPVGAEKSIRAQRSVVLKAGNAAAIELFHNDKLVPPLGGANQVKTVEFTSAGMRQ